MNHLIWTIKVFISLLFAISTTALAIPITNNFDTLTDNESVTAQFADLAFSNAVALQSGVSLNEFEFPPRSGDMVISDLGGPISIIFANPISKIEGHFTYLTTLSLTAFDAGGGLLGSVNSLFSSNLALSGELGSSPNELLSFSAGSGIRSILIAGDAGGGSFTLDDLSYTAIGSTTSVPEPETLFLLLSGLGIMGIAWGRR